MKIWGLIKVPSKRLDHDRPYMAVVFGLLFTSISILSHWSTPTLVLSGLGLTTENLMAIILLNGSLMALYGIASGTRFFRKEADLRDCYSLAKWSLISISSALMVFSYGMITTSTFLWPPIFPVEILIGLSIAGLFKAIDFHYGRELITVEIKHQINLHHSGHASMLDD